MSKSNRVIRSIQITHYGMRASLFTNGIRATRALLAALCEAGLTDVAFHVDLTQQRKGYGSEVELNAVREQYIERARGLPLSDRLFSPSAHPHPERALRVGLATSLRHLPHRGIRPGERRCFST